MRSVPAETSEQELRIKPAQEELQVQEVREITIARSERLKICFTG